MFFFLLALLIRLLLSKGHCPRDSNNNAHGVACKRGGVARLLKISSSALSSTCPNSKLKIHMGFQIILFTYAYLAPLSPMHCFTRPSMPCRACPSMIIICTCLCVVAGHSDDPLLLWCLAAVPWGAVWSRLHGAGSLPRFWALSVSCQCSGTYN